MFEHIRKPERKRSDNAAFWSVLKSMPSYFKSYSIKSCYKRFQNTIAKWRGNFMQIIKEVLEFCLPDGMAW